MEAIPLAVRRRPSASLGARHPVAVADGGCGATRVDARTVQTGDELRSRHHARQGAVRVGLLAHEHLTARREQREVEVAVVDRSSRRGVGRDLADRDGATDGCVECDERPAQRRRSADDADVEMGLPVRDDGGNDDDGEHDDEKEDRRDRVGLRPDPLAHLTARDDANDVVPHCSTASRNSTDSGGRSNEKFVTGPSRCM